MNNSVFNDFVREKDCPGTVLEKYKELVPSEIIDIWQQYGLGSFKNGFLKTINPDEYIGILECICGEQCIYTHFRYWDG